MDDEAEGVVLDEERVVHGLQDEVLHERLRDVLKNYVVKVFFKYCG